MENTDGYRLPTYAITALILGIVLRLIIILYAPVNDYPSNVPAFNDESSHLNHVIFRMWTGHTPAQRMSASEDYSLDRGEVEYSQPPLYYLIQAGLLKLTGSVVLLRLYNMVCWFVALWILVRSLPCKRMAGPVVLAASLPGISMVPSATINNDGLLALVVAGIYALCAKILRGKISIIDVFNLSLLAALGAWTKLSALTMMPMVLASVYIGTNGNKSRKLLTSAIVILVFTWFTLPLWLERNTAFSGLLTLGSAAGDFSFVMRDAIVAVIYSIVSPWMSTWPSYFVKIPAIVLFLLLMISVVLLAARLIRSKSGVREKVGDKSKLLLIVWSIGGFFGIISWLYYGIKYFQVDARLLIPAAPFLIIILSWPLWSPERKTENLMGWGILPVMLIPYLSWGIF